MPPAVPAGESEVEVDGTAATVLIVEDSPTQALHLQYILEQNGYEVVVASDGQQAVEMIADVEPAVVISDIVMPAMDGYEVCLHIKGDPRWREVGVILVTSLSQPEVVIRALQCGADKFITKPYDGRYLLSAVESLLADRRLPAAGDGVVTDITYRGETYPIAADRRQILTLLLSTYETAVAKNLELIEAQAELQELNRDLEDRVRRRTAALTVTMDKLHRSVHDTVKAMAGLVEAADPYTAGHQERVGELALAIATELGMEEDRLDGLRVAGVIHDIGKISVPRQLLVKPTRLTDLEMDLIRGHAEAGFIVLRDIEFPWPVARVVHEHHERMDGSGYPQGLAGDQLLLESRVLAVADVVESMAAHRPYRPALGVEAGLAELRDGAGVLFDTEVVAACEWVVRQGLVDLSEGDHASEPFTM